MGIDSVVGVVLFFSEEVCFVLVVVVGGVCRDDVMVGSVCVFDDVKFIVIGLVCVVYLKCRLEIVL